MIFKPKTCETHGHAYEARYDFSEPNMGSIKHCSAQEANRMLETSKRKTYVHDICVRCGDIKKREGKCA